MKKNISSREVAEVAGVSQSAVSRCFTPGAVIAEKTRQRILKVSADLGYRPNAIARSLITSKSRIIAVVNGYFENPFYPKALELLSEMLSRAGYRMLLFSAGPNGRDPDVDQMLQYQVDGVLLLSSTLTSDLFETLDRYGVPTLLFNRVDKNNRGASVTADNFGGGYQIGQYLLDRGHRRFGYVSGTQSSSTNRDRFAGYCAALQKAGYGSPAILHGDYDAQISAHAVIEGFRGGLQIDALFVANDHMAIAVMDALRLSLGKRIPEDISVVGFDDAPPASWGSYQLTTYTQPLKPMVHRAVEILTGMIDAGDVNYEHALIPGELKIRRTVR